MTEPHLLHRTRLRKVTSVTLSKIKMGDQWGDSEEKLLKNTLYVDVI